MTRFLALAAMLGLMPIAALAQDKPNTILVLDGSGSMWGQIDGVAKITIAQQVVGDLLQDFPADQGLGLTIYGHRTRGDCTDIETVVAPAPGTAAAIAAAVNGIKPLGKTPMTDAVIAAAQALRYTEDTATVILVSDGVETCNPDPCAAARLLEEAGIGFTAHVIGFDVGADPDALAQMQCIADETGGQFLTADTADQLTAALATVAAAPAPDPAPQPSAITFQAFEGEDTVTGTQITEDIIWTVTGPAGETLVENQAAANFDLDLTEGAYTVIALRPSTEDVSEGTLDVVGIADFYTAFFPAPVLSATLTAPETAALGSTIDVTWDGPNDTRDYIAVSDPSRGDYVNYIYTEDGNPARLLMPPKTGTYELRYVSNATKDILATRLIEVAPVEVTLNAADQAVVGAQVEVTWTGPDYARDYIAVGKVGDDRYINYTRTEDGAPLMLEMPTEAGDYEIRYHLNQRGEILARRVITVSDAVVTLDAADSAAVGATIPVTWTGPDYDRDYISVGNVGEDGYINYTRTEDGSPLMLEMPAEPGAFEIRYHLNQGGEILARRAITVNAVEVGLVAPDTAIAGERITVGWTGPNYDRDYIAVSAVGDGGYVNYTYTADGNPLTLEMPTQPGDYEVRYVLNQGAEVLVARPITVTGLKVTLQADGTAPAGATIPVTFEGPNYPRDYIAVGRVGDDGYINYTNTEHGNPAQVQMPGEPGDYELRYVLNQGATIVQRLPITIAAVTAQIVAPDTGVTGNDLVVGWDGPGYPGDYIAIGVPGDNSYLDYARVSDGNPVTVRLPDTAGTYELKYILDQGAIVLGTRAIEVTK